MARWKDALTTALRRQPRTSTPMSDLEDLPAVHDGDAPPVLTVPAALVRLRAQARADFALRRAAGGPVRDWHRTAPLTWDDVESSLETTLALLDRAPRSLVLQLGVEVQEQVTWWRRSGARGLDEFLDAYPMGRSTVADPWADGGAMLDELVFGGLYLLPWQFAKGARESLRNVRRAYNTSGSFSISPVVPLRWSQRVRVVQVTAALEAQRSDHVSALQAAGEAAGERGYNAADNYHSRVAMTVFVTRELGRWVTGTRSFAQLADGLVARIPWLTDQDLTERRLREVLAVPVARPAIRR
jgi:hypothetical protein